MSQNVKPQQRTMQEQLKSLFPSNKSIEQQRKDSGK